MKVKTTVVVTSPSFSKSTLLMNELAKLNIKIKANEEGIRLTKSGLIEFLKSDENIAAIIGLEQIDDDTLDRCPNLKFIAKYGVGLDNLDLQAMESRAVGLGWSAGVNRRSVSELVMAFTLGHLRNVTPSILKMKRNEWVKNGGRQLSDCKVGIIGLGHIGADVGQLVKAFGATVFYADIVDKSVLAKQMNFLKATYEQILSECDIITFHVPSTHLTRKMFSIKELEIVNRDALIINTARGDIVDFESTARAVQERKLGGFACDVFDEEPCDLSAYASVDSLYFTPHIGGNSAEAVLAMGRSAINHISSYLESSAGDSKQ